MQICPVSIKYNNINFKSQKTNPKPSIIDKYGIDINKLKVINSSNIVVSDNDKKTIVEKILEAHELAKKNYSYGNIAKAGYATNICLDNNTWHLATNYNNTRNDISSICGERAAVVGAYNELLKSKPLDNPKNEDLNFKVKLLAMSSYKEVGTDRNASAPCAECLSWFNTTRYFDDNTTIASLDKDRNNELVLNLTPLKDYLPYRNETNKVPEKIIDEMDIRSTESAYKSVKQKHLNKADILQIVKETKKLYKENPKTATNMSNQNIAASVLANGKLFSAQKIDFSKRWFIEPAEFAAAKAIEEFDDKTHIDCICIIGNNKTTDSYGITHNDGIVNIKTLGELNTRYASTDTLVVTTTDDKINIRTIGDYMPDKFKFIQAYNTK